MPTSETTTETQADKIRNYLESDPNTPRKVSEVAEAIGADDTRRLGSYLANMATRGSIARAATGLYVANPHKGGGQGTASATEHRGASAAAERSAAKRQSRPARRPAAKTAGAKTRRTVAASRPEHPEGGSPQPFHTAGSLDDGRIILRSSDDILWVAQRLNG